MSIELNENAAWGSLPCPTANRDRKLTERRKELCHQIVETREGWAEGALMDAASVKADVVLIAACLYLYI